MSRSPTLTAAEAAVRLGLSDRRVRVLIRDGLLRAREPVHGYRFALRPVR